MTAFQHVLVGLDVHQQTAADAILGRACELAQPDQIEAVHVCNRFHREHRDYPEGNFETSEALDEAIHRQAGQYLKQVSGRRGITRVRVLQGNAADAVHAYAKESTDLVVVGCHGHHGARTLFGSTSNAMIHGTPCDVLAVHIDEGHDGHLPAYEKILVAVDLGDESFQVMEEANRVAEHCGAELAVCNVTQADYDPLLDEAAERLAHLAESYGIDEENMFEVAGSVAHRVHALGTDIGADLIVVGTHGKHGLQLLTGSTANAVLHGARCDVLAVRMH
ncbi:MAG: universal stress protein [Pseudomonadales bacterium]|nr:universal stress protein [Pseudomonadales bacterium]